MVRENTIQPPLNDAELLTAYTRGNQQSFRELVDRHASWVFASALRQLHDNQLAEDATQAVFIILCKHAKYLTTHGHLPGWLFNTTKYCVRALQRAERRRQIHERRAAMQRAETHAEPSQLTTSLDAAVARLSAKERDAVVMRFYQQLDFPDVAIALGISEAAARKRVTRALEQLRNLLGQGAVPSSLALAALHGLPSNAATFSAHISHTALTAASGAKLASGVTIATKGALFLMATTPTKIAAGIAIALVCVAGIGFTAFSLSHSTSSAPTSAESTPTPPPPSADIAPDARFEDVYKQPPGTDDVVLIHPPFIDARLAFYETSNPEQAKALPKGPDALIVGFNDGKPTLCGETVGNGKGYTVQDLITFLLNIDAPNIEGSDTLLKKQIPGDFLVNGVPGTMQPDWSRGLERVLTSSLGGTITLNFRDVDCPVFLLHGQWSPKNTDGTLWNSATPQHIEIYGAALNRDLHRGDGGSGSKTDFAKKLGAWINQPVVIECNNVPQDFAWHCNDNLGSANPDDHMLAHDPDLVLQHISEQTGLTVSQETRKIRRLFADWKKTITTPMKPPQ